MPVVIKEFSVDAEHPGTPEAAGRPQAVQGQTQAQPRAQGARQAIELLKAAQQRACRLHAD